MLSYIKLEAVIARLDRVAIDWTMRGLKYMTVHQLTGGSG